MWGKILTRISLSLIVAGVAPYAYLLLWALVHNQEPLSVQLPLKRGEYISPYFRTDLDDTYQINLYWTRFPDPQTEVDLDWKIVDDTGTVIQQGVYQNRMRRANIAGLGSYRPKCGLRQRIFVNIHLDVKGPDAQPRLQIGVPELSLELAEGFSPLAFGWAVIVAGTGVIILAVLRMRRAR